jgi:hypothetical protein
MVVCACLDSRNDHTLSDSPIFHPFVGYSINTNGFLMKSMPINQSNGRDWNTSGEPARCLEPVATGRWSGAGTNQKVLIGRKNQGLK